MNPARKVAAGLAGVAEAMLDVGARKPPKKRWLGNDYERVRLRQPDNTVRAADRGRQAVAAYHARQANQHALRRRANAAKRAQRDARIGRRGEYELVKPTFEAA